MAVIYDQGLSMFLWADARNTTVYVQNRSPHRILALLHGNRSLEVGNLFQWFSRSQKLWNCMRTFPFLWELQWELGKVSGALKTVFFGVPAFLGVVEYKACRQIC